MDRKAISDLLWKISGPAVSVPEVAQARRDVLAAFDDLVDRADARLDLADALADAVDTDLKGCIHNRVPFPHKLISALRSYREAQQ